MTSAPPDQRDCSLLVSITFHYLETRLPILVEVIRTLCEFEARRLDCVILTNDIAPAEAATIARILTPWFPPGQRLEVKPCANFGHPHDLPWQAKPLIAKRFLSSSEYTHFVQLEDDIRFSARNFRYWLRQREALRDAHLIPSFIRVEYRASRQEVVCVDITRPVRLPDGPGVQVADEFAFYCASNPYCAMFVLDRALAAEYVETRSFSRDASAAVVRWGTRERAAAGLCWENPPEGFACRHVIPARRQDLMIPADAWIAHLTNNYADGLTKFGKLTVDRMILA